MLNLVESKAMHSSMQRVSSPEPRMPGKTYERITQRHHSISPPISEVMKVMIGRVLQIGDFIEFLLNRILTLP